MKRIFPVILVVLGLLLGSSVSITHSTETQPESPVAVNAVGAPLYVQNHPVSSTRSAGQYADFFQTYADEFVVPVAQTWDIGGIGVDMTGTTPDNWLVQIYNNNAGLPGTVACSEAVTSATMLGDFNVFEYSSPCSLTAGTYWVEVRPNYSCALGGGCSSSMSFAGTVTGSEMAIMNTSCVTWTLYSTCTGQSPGDMRFAIYAVALDLTASAACVGENLDVMISGGDGPFNITASGGINMPVNGVGIGTTTINGPEKWDDVTVTETVGDLESINLGQYKCRSGEIPTPLTPAHQSHTTNAFPTFSWTAISGANDYRVFVYDDKVVANRTVDIRENSGGPTSMTLSVPLPDGRLFWRARGRQNSLWSLWSVRFTLFKDPVVPLTINMPAPDINLNVPPLDNSAPPVGPVPAVPAPPNSR